MKKPWIVLPTLIGSLLIACAACTLLKQQPAVTDIAIEFATAKVIEAKGANETLPRAQNIKTIAVAIQGVAGGDSVTIAALEAEAGVYIRKLNLSTADLLLANALVATISTDLSQKVNGGMLKPEDVAVVKQVMQDVINACALYGA